MTTLRETLEDFTDILASLLGRAPDSYPDWGYRDYKRDKAEAQELWSIVRAKLKQDTDKIEFIDAKLKEALDAFDAGDKKTGRKIVGMLYSLPVRNLR